MYPVSVEYLKTQWIIPNWGGGLWEQQYIYIFPIYVFCECVCVCFCVWFCLYSLLLPFVLGFCLSMLFLFFCVFFNIVLALLIIGGLDFGLVALFFLSFCLLLFIFNNIFFIFYFNNFIFFLLSFFLFFPSLFFWAVWLTGSWCSGQVSGLSLWGGRAEFRTLVHERPAGST